MKVLAAFALFFSLPAHGAWDSLAVIVRPEKALVQINEPGAASRLRSFIHALSDDGGFVLTSNDSSIKLDCGTSEGAASCVMRFLPGTNVVLKQKFVQGNVFARDLGISEDRGLGNLELSFLNSNGDRFTIRTHGSQLELMGTKR